MNTVYISNGSKIKKSMKDYQNVQILIWPTQALQTNNFEISSRAVESFIKAIGNNTTFIFLIAKRRNICRQPRHNSKTFGYLVINNLLKYDPFRCSIVRHTVPRL